MIPNVEVSDLAFRENEGRLERSYLCRYALLTLAVFIPQLVTFYWAQTYWPVPRWSMFSEVPNLAAGKLYYRVRGETVEGTDVEIPPYPLTNALYQGCHTTVWYALANRSFKIHHPHPTNVRMLASRPGPEALPEGVWIPDLLRTWGDLYNERLPASSPERLRAIRLDALEWPGGSYDNYENLKKSWRVKL